MRRLLAAVLPLLMFLAAAVGSRAEVSPRIVHVELVPPSPYAIGDRFVLRAVLLVPKGTEPKPALPDEPDEAIEWGSPATRRLEEPAPPPYVRWEVTYPIQIFDLGDFAIRPVEIGVGMEVLETKPLTVKVESIRSGPDAALLKDVRPPVPIPRRNRWLIVALVLGLLSIAVGTVLFVRKRRRRTPLTAAPQPVPLTPEEWLSRELDGLAASRIDDPEALREFVARVANVVREYLARKAGIPAPQRTTLETLRTLRRLVPEGTLRAVEEILTGADFAKFAKETPEATTARAYVERARALCAALAEQLSAETSPPSPTPGTSSTEHPRPRIES